jgi:two-component sensor histidine kinase
VTDGRGTQVRLEWRETGGPPVAPVRQKGFGSALIERGFVAQLGGRVTLDFLPTGVRCTLECPVD